MKILLVEDDPAVREYLEMCLVDAGLQVTTAASSAVALDLVSRILSPDVVVADFNLGGMLDGVDVAQKLIIRCPEASLILISGRPDLARTKLAEAMDGSLARISFLSKPFVGDDLLAAIEKIMRPPGDTT